MNAWDRQMSDSREHLVNVVVQPSFHRVGSAAALRGGEPLLGMVQGQEIAVFAVEGGFIATSGQCPHAGGPLHEGDIEDGVLTCPWHGWTFDLSTGQCADDPCFRIERFEVRVEGDDILVRV